MAKKRESEPVSSPISTFPDGAFPLTRERRPGHGARGVRMQPAPEVAQFTAAEAAEASPLFSGGGSSFVRWLGDDHRAEERRSMADWAELLAAFAARSIFGHRRRLGSATHHRR